MCRFGSLVFAPYFRQADGTRFGLNFVGQCTFVCWTIYISCRLKITKFTGFTNFTWAPTTPSPGMPPGIPSSFSWSIDHGLQRVGSEWNSVGFAFVMYPSPTLQLLVGCTTYVWDSLLLLNLNTLMSVGSAGFSGLWLYSVLCCWFSLACVWLQHV